MNIIKLTRDQYKSVRCLFHHKFPNVPIVFGIIEGILPGQIWVDDVGNPEFCLIITEFHYCFISGKFSKTIWHLFLDLLKEKSLIHLICECATASAKLELIKCGFTKIPRVQYQYDRTHPVVMHKKINSQFTLEKINKNNFHLCAWKDLMARIYGNVDNYINNAESLVLFDAENQQVICEVHGIASKMLVGLATVTHESYRGQQLSPAVCNSLISNILKNGKTPIWSCDESNIASRKTADKLGMIITTKYTFYVLNKLDK